MQSYRTELRNELQVDEKAKLEKNDVIFLNSVRKHYCDVAMMLHDPIHIGSKNQFHPSHL